MPKSLGRNLDPSTLHECAQMGFYEPFMMPYVKRGEELVCGIKMGRHSDFFLITNLDEAKEVWRMSVELGSLGTYWYTRPIEATEPTPQPIDPLYYVILDIANRQGVSMNEQVVKTILSYASDNVGVANKLTSLCLTFTTPQEVEELVGWPLSQHNQAKAADIWDRFR